MRAVAHGVAVAILACSAPAHADGKLFEIGLGAPGGVTFGFGLRAAGWQAVAEVGGAAGGMAGMLSASAQLHTDVHTWRTTVLALGVSMTRLGFMAGAEDVATGTVDTFGPTLQLRVAASHRTKLVLEAGAGAARCHGDCSSDVFIMPELTGRMIVEL
jgi:hypothetical protein